LEALSSSQRAQLPASITPPDPAYRSRLEKVFEQHAGGQHQLDNFMLVQRVWDETMAQNVIRFLQPNPQWRMVVFSGSGHISHGAGIPQDVIQQRPDISVTTVVSSDESDIQADAVDYHLLSKPFSLPPTGRLGVKLNTAPNAVMIGAMLENSAAQRAGLQKGDRITAIDGLSVMSMSDLMLALTHYKPRQQVQVMVQRQGVADLTAYNVVLQ
jgi:predicted metalloprotease with PDZ domain